MSAHTQGPWLADIRTGLFAVYVGERRNCLDGCGAWSVVDQGGRGELSNGPESYRLLTEEQKANARLIAAAPDLLDLARRVAASFDGTDAPLGEAAEAIIAKVRGR